jgi:hypothetical protein
MERSVGFDRSHGPGHRLEGRSAPLLRYRLRRAEHHVLRGWTAPARGPAARAERRLGARLAAPCCVVQGGQGPMGVPISQWCPNGSVMRPSRQRANTVAWIIDGIRDRADLRQGITRRHAIDQIWLLMDPAVYHHLTRYRGWSPATYEKWFTDTITRLLLD